MIDVVLPVISLGADVGGRDAHEATKLHVRELRKLLEKRCIGPYSDVFREIHLVLRIDGSVQSWGESGVKNLRLQRKAGYATADIFVPINVWSNVSDSVFREFIAAGVLEAIVGIVMRAEKIKVPIAFDKLSADVRDAIAEFIG